jgi:hypothetical protein
MDSNVRATREEIVAAQRDAQRQVGEALANLKRCIIYEHRMTDTLWHMDKEQPK